MPVARATVETVAPNLPEYIEFLHNSGITTQFEVQLNKETGKHVVKCNICGIYIYI